MDKITQDQLDASQLPALFEYEQRAEDDVLARTHEGFTLKVPVSLEFGDWRIRVNGAILYVEHVAGTTWTEQGRFEL